MELDLFLLDDHVWIAQRPVHVATYDFAFERLFPCRRPWWRPDVVTIAARVGAFDDYTRAYGALRADGLTLINSVEEHERAVDLPTWYPLLADLTPRSRWFTVPPPVEVIAADFGWPVFIKGSRQTARHDASKAIARDAADYARIVAAFGDDPILGWQTFVVRELVSLRPVAAAVGTRIRPSFEFRTFWWRGALVGAGPYWAGEADYRWTEAERAAALAVAERAAARLDVPFLVVDVAQADDGTWLVIEPNDAQESGYAGVSPIALWSAILARERG